MRHVRGHYVGARRESLRLDVEEVHAAPVYGRELAPCGSVRLRRICAKVPLRMDVVAGLLLPVLLVQLLGLGGERPVLRIVSHVVVAAEVERLGKRRVVNIYAKRR